MLVLKLEAAQSLIGLCAAFIYGRYSYGRYSPSRCPRCAHCPYLGIERLNQADFLTDPAHDSEVIKPFCSITFV